MAEPTLAVDYTSLKVEISTFMGYGRDWNRLRQVEKDEVDFIIQSGMRQFYLAAVQSDEEKLVSHKWTFLNPAATISLVSGTAAYSLPDNFGGKCSEFVAYGVTIPVISLEHFQSLAATGAANATPKYATIRVTTADPTTRGSRYEAAFWPTPSANATATYSYGIIPDKLSDTNKYPHGGAQHAETIFESCLAIAEQRSDDAVKNVHTQLYQALLAVSIQFDKAMVPSSAPFDVDTATTSLALRYEDFVREVGELLGYGGSIDALDKAELARVDSIVQSGLRRFYGTVLVPGARTAHRWSFLSPTISLTTVAETYLYDLPVGFVAPNGAVTYYGDSFGFKELTQVSEATLHRFRGLRPGSGVPIVYAIRPKAATGATEPLFEVLFHPTPSDAYTIEMKCSMRPYRISRTAPYPLGVHEHGDTILAACLMEAEPKAGGGSYWGSVFMERVANSVERDKQSIQPRSLGFNLNGPMKPIDTGRCLSLEYIGGNVNTNDRLGALETGNSVLSSFVIEIVGGGGGVLRNDANTGFKVTAKSTPTMAVLVAPGLAVVMDALVKQAAIVETVPVLAPTLHNRIDLVQLSTSGSVGIRMGAENSSPAAPEPSAGCIALANIYMRPGMTCIKDTDDGVNGYITDARTIR